MKRPNRGGINICRKDFAMGKGKSIYSATVLGNGRGERARGGDEASGKIFTNIQGKQTKQRTRNGARSGASKRAQVDFQKRKFPQRVVD